MATALTQQATRIVAPFSGEYCFLSNFHPCNLLYFGTLWPTVEHAYQFAKLPAKDRMKWRDRFLNCATPGDAKRLGRRIPLRGYWEDVKLNVMESLVRRKFDDTENPGLTARLVELADTPEVKTVLVETNHWHDNFWGTCTCARYGNCGENHLGLILMKVRDELCRK